MEGFNAIRRLPSFVFAHQRGHSLPAKAPGLCRRNGKRVVAYGIILVIPLPDNEDDSQTLFLRHCCYGNGGHSPNGVANVICHQKRARSIQGHTYGSSLRVAVFNQEA